MNSQCSPLAELSSNPHGWFARDFRGNPVGFSSKNMLSAVEEAESNGYFVRWGDRVIDEQYKAELARRIPRSA